MPGAIRVAVVAVALAGLTGCGTSDDRAAARATTIAFYEAVREGDGARACDQLSADAEKQLESRTGQDCEDAITRLEFAGGEVGAAVVFVTNAKVDLSSGESAFLSLEPEGWRLSAVACRPADGPPKETPFDCEVEV